MEKVDVEECSCESAILTDSKSQLKVDGDGLGSSLTEAYIVQIEGQLSLLAIMPDTHVHRGNDHCFGERFFRKCA